MFIVLVIFLCFVFFLFVIVLCCYDVVMVIVFSLCFEFIWVVFFWLCVVVRVIVLVVVLFFGVIGLGCWKFVWEFNGCWKFFVIESREDWLLVDVECCLDFGCNFLLLILVLVIVRVMVVGGDVKVVV